MIPQIGLGKRVVVPFGKKRFYAAIVHRVNVQPSKATKSKEIAYVMDETPVLTDTQLKMWEWMAFYYMAGLGSVMNTAFPNAMKLSSQTILSLNPNYDGDLDFSEDERMVFAQLSAHNSLSIDQIEMVSAKRAIQRAVNSLVKRGVVVINEEMKDASKPLTIEHVSLSADYNSDAAIASLLKELDRAPKQFEIVMRFLEMRSAGGVVIKPQLLKRSGASTASLNALMDKGVFRIEKVLRYADEQTESHEFALSEQQLKAVDDIKSNWASQVAVLLHGVTGSGKTLVYAQLIKECVAKGKQVLYLVPEIALTTQLVERLKTLLGEELLVYHSGFSNRDRLTTWLRLLDSANNEIIIGARSALFLPLNNLGLIIVDEEHETSFKQHEAAPHYNARDTAIWLASQSKAKVVLGSATPAIESMFNAKRGKYGFVELSNRFAGMQLPLVNIVDMTKSKRADMENSGFSGDLVEAVKHTIAINQQVILFQNRRGYAPYLICEACGWSAECANCDVNLTYHKFFDKMLCHLCGHGYKMLKHCPDCHSAKLKVKGLGTEKVEDDLERIFPNARIARMDLDTTRKKNAFQNILTSFEEGSVDILVGTQMVTKGLDFTNVGLVGVLNADSLWNRPDFRAFERAFQLLTQVAGRAGRKSKRGQVMIQTFRVEHPVLQFVIDNSYDDMYNHQIAERQQFLYPPFVRMIMIQLAHPDPNLAREGANYLGGLLRKQFGKRVLGPEEPSIARVRGNFLRQIYLKLEQKIPLSDSRNLIWQCVDEMEGHQNYRKIKIRIDVDPY